MSGSTHRFGVSEFTTWPWSFEKDVQHYAGHGINAIEVCEFKLNRNDYSPQLREIGEFDLTVSSVQSTVHSLFSDSLAPSPTDPDDRVRHIKTAIERIAPHVPASVPFVVITGAAPGGDSERVYEKCLTALAELAEFAAKHRMRIAFEPLNPVLFNTDTALWGLDEALELVQRIAHPALGICLDTWNVFQTPDLHDVIRACGDRIFLVQVSDWHRPRSAADRISLGDGIIDNARIMKTTREAGYRGPYVLEIFSSESLPDSIWRADLDAVLDHNTAAFARNLGFSPIVIPRRIYDLSQPVFTNCPQYPDENPRPAQIRLFYMVAVQGVNKEIVEISTHTGTHCDAPFHFFADGTTIDQVPLESYVGPAVIVDLRNKRLGTAIEVPDLKPRARDFSAGDIVLLNTGGGHRRGNSRAFLTEYVYLSGEAAELLVNCGVKGVGIDAVSLGGYKDPEKAAPAHRVLLEHGKFIVEELYFPDEVMDGRARLFVAAPVKLQGCSGAWTRAMLWEF